MIVESNRVVLYEMMNRIEKKKDDIINVECREKERVGGR